MKTIVTLAALLFVTHLASAQNNVASDLSESDQGITITVEVPVMATEGIIIAGLYDENTFMKAAPLQGTESAINDGKAVLTFSNVSPGTYGITLFLDKNGNHTMDFEPNGMPKEMYGVSNNVMNYGPPQWKDAQFEVGTEPIKMEIRL